MKMFYIFAFTLAVILNSIELSTQSDLPGYPPREKLPIRRRIEPSSNEPTRPADQPAFQLGRQSDVPRDPRRGKSPIRHEPSSNEPTRPADQPGLQRGKPSDLPSLNEPKRRAGRPRKDEIGSSSSSRRARRRNTTLTQIYHLEPQSRPTVNLKEIYYRNRPNSKVGIPSSSSSDDSSSPDSSPGSTPPRGRFIYVKGQPDPYAKLGYVRLIPHSNPNRRFEFRRFVIPGEKMLYMWYKSLNTYEHMKTEKYIVLSTQDGIVFAFVEYPRIFRGLYSNNDYHTRIKINMINKHVSYMTADEIEECQVDQYGPTNQRSFTEETVAYDSLAVYYR